MKKLIFTYLILLISLINYAQEIKVKKGQILLNEKAIAKVESPKLREYKISNLDGAVTINAYMRVGSTNMAFIEIKNEITGKINELDFVKYSPFNVEKSIVQTLFSKQMITENGIDLDKINAFLNETPAGLSEKYGYVNQETIDKENALADSFKIVIDDNGIVFSKNVQIGTIRMIISNGKTTNGAVEKYEVIDLDNNIIGTWFSEFGSIQGYKDFLNQELITYDKKVFKIKFDNSGNFVGYKMSKDVTAKEIVKKLLINNYMLNHQYKNLKN